MKITGAALAQIGIACLFSGTACWSPGVFKAAWISSKEKVGGWPKRRSQPKRPHPRDII